MEKVIHFIIPEIPNQEQLDVIELAKKLHSSWEIMVWQDPIKKDGFLLEKYWDKANSGAQLADLLRLDVVYRFGGVYIDSDLRLFRSMDGLADNYDFFIASEDGVVLTNAIFGAKKEHPALKVLIDELNNNEPDWTRSPVETTGPSFFAENLKWRDDISVLPRETFYTYNWNEAPLPNHKLSFGEHLWAHSWWSDQDIANASAVPIKLSKYKTAIKCFIKPYAIRLMNGFRRFNSLGKPVVRNFSSYMRTDEILIKTIHGHSIVADGMDLSVTPELVFNGYYGFPEEEFLKKVLRGGDWFVDVGSNIGTFSLLAAQKVGAFGRIFSFEPNPRSYKLFSKSLVLNRMHERVIQRPCAVGSNKENVQLTFSKSRLGDGQISAKDIDGSIFSSSIKKIDDVVTVDALCVRLDDEFLVNLPIKILKIDVEGYESFVLKGAARLLKSQCFDNIMLDMVKEVAGSQWSDFLIEVRNIISLGYKVCTLNNDGNLIHHETLEAALRSNNGKTIVLTTSSK